MEIETLYTHFWSWAILSLYLSKNGFFSSSSICSLLRTLDVENILSWYLNREGASSRCVEGSNLNTTLSIYMNFYFYWKLNFESTAKVESRHLIDVRTLISIDNALFVWLSISMMNAGEPLKNSLFKLSTLQVHLIWIWKVEKLTTYIVP